MLILAVYLLINIVVMLALVAVSDPMLALSFVGIVAGFVFLLLLPSFLVDLWRWAFGGGKPHA